MANSFNESNVNFNSTNIWLVTTQCKSPWIHCGKFGPGPFQDWLLWARCERHLKFLPRFKWFIFLKLFFISQLIFKSEFDSEILDKYKKGWGYLNHQHSTVKKSHSPNCWTRNGNLTFSLMQTYAKTYICIWTERFLAQRSGYFYRVWMERVFGHKEHNNNNNNANGLVNGEERGGLRMRRGEEEE